MSETTAEYRVKDKIDIRKHIEQESILGAFNRLFSVVNEAYQKVESAKGTPAYKERVERYVELEKLALELSRFALDYFIAQSRHEAAYDHESESEIIK